jgi:hypothetical protein
MKKLGYAIAALGLIAIAAPSIANAETVVIRHGGGHHFERSHAEFRGHRDWHPHHDHVVIVKHRRY